MNVWNIISLLYMIDSWARYRILSSKYFFLLEIWRHCSSSFPDSYWESAILSSMAGFFGVFFLEFFWCLEFSLSPWDARFYDDVSWCETLNPLCRGLSETSQHENSCPSGLRNSYSLFSLSGSPIFFEYYNSWPGLQSFFLFFSYIFYLWYFFCFPIFLLHLACLLS